MLLFYNLSGTIIGLLALFMLSIRPLPGSDGLPFNTAKKYLTAMFLLTALSMFVSRFEPRLSEHVFEKVSAPMLLFFFLIAQGFLFSLLTLYDSPYASWKYIRRMLLPVGSLCVLYTAVFFIEGEEVFVYSAAEFFTRLPSEILLVLRCVLLVAVVLSVAYGVVLCHRAKTAYNRMIHDYFSQTDFARSLWLSKLLGCAEALSLWVLLTYFYTTPVLEVVVGLLIVALFVFYLKEFREYARRHDALRPAVSCAQQAGGGLPQEDEKAAMQEIFAQLDAWALRKDKPFTQSKLTIGDVAHEIGFPKHRLSWYVNHREKNFCTWINQLRIQEAARQLIDFPDRSVSEIAQATGFCDLPAFSRAFKKANGVPPRTFRTVQSRK